jgi:hypothetical protein
MLNLHTVLSNGISSKGYDFETEDEAVNAFERVKSQLIAMKFVGALSLSDGGIEVQRETFNAS